MKSRTQLQAFLTLSLPLMWTGIVVGISFLETPLKFTAPGVTIEIGVGIGQVVFTAMKKVEWLLFLTWVSLILLSRLNGPTGSLLLLLLLLTAQTCILLPLLNERIELLQKGITPERSSLHSLYIVSEAAKLLTLFYSSYHLFKEIIQSFINKTIQHDQDSHTGSKLVASQP